MEKLAEFDINKDPFETFQLWYTKAKDSEENPNAYAFSTSTQDGKPSVRYLLHKGIYQSCFKIFGSNYSQKASHLLENPLGAMAFFWPTLMRQVRIEGEIIPMPTQLVENYFFTRSKESQVASAISKQSWPLDSREFMLNKFEQHMSEHSKKASLPHFWQGWLLKPTVFEFFIYQNHRLNDRFRFKRVDLKGYEIQRLWP